MGRKKTADKLPEGEVADIRLAIHEFALTGGHKKNKAQSTIKKTDSGKEKLHLYGKVMNGEASCQEIVYLSFLRGMITKEQYLDYLQIEKDCAEYGDEESS